MHPSASPLVTFGIAALSIAVGAGFVALNRVAAARLGQDVRAVTFRTSVGVTAWLALGLLIGWSGLVLRFDLRPPPMVIMLVTLLGVGVTIAVSTTGKRLATGLPLSTLVLFQAFRLPLELVMHEAAHEGTMPNALSFSGYNFDIVTGASALVLGLALRRARVPRWIVRAWCYFGMAALCAIAAIALLSSPLFAAFGRDQLNTWVGYVPFTWLPWVLVVAAIAGHGIVLRALREPPTGA